LEVVVVGKEVLVGAGGDVVGGALLVVLGTRGTVEPVRGDVEACGNSTGRPLTMTTNDFADFEAP
jgi:hypothetical protein